MFCIGFIRVNAGAIGVIGLDDADKDGEINSTIKARLGEFFGGCGCLTNWSSAYNATKWIAIDMGRASRFDKITLSIGQSRNGMGD
jgi:hypothetical protein